MNGDYNDEDIDLYEDLDKVEISRFDQDDISQNPFILCKTDLKHGDTNISGINRGIDIQEQTSSDLDLYSELLYNDIKEKQEKERKEKEESIRMRKENADLKQSQHLLETELERLKIENGVLKQNISSLYKTAKEEIDFKTELITELRDELDEYIFRRRARPNNRPYKHSINDAKYNKSREMVECDTTTEHESKEEKICIGFKSFGHNHSIANADNIATRQASKDISEVKKNNKDTLKDIECVIDTVLHKFVNEEGESLGLDKSMHGEKQVSLMSNLKKIMLLAMGKNSGGVTRVNSNNNIVKRDRRKGLQQGKFHAKTVSGKRRNDEEQHRLSSKKFCVSIPEKTSSHQLPHVQSYHDNKNALDKPPEKFSNSQKKDVFKLYLYHNMDVPYAVRRRLGIPLTKNSAKPTGQNISSKLKPPSLKKISDEVCTVTESAPKMYFIDSQSTQKNAQRQNFSSESELTLSKESNNVCVVKLNELRSSKTSLINRQPSPEIELPCETINLVASPLTDCSKVLPIITSFVEKTYKGHEVINSNSEDKSEIDFSDIIDFGLKTLDGPNPERGSENMKEKSELVLSLHKMKSKLTDKNDCVPSKEIGAMAKLDKIDFSNIIDFGLKTLDDSSSKRKNGAKKKKFGSSLHKIEHKLIKKSTKRVYAPSKELNVPVRQNTKKKKKGEKD